MKNISIKSLITIALLFIHFGIVAQTLSGNFVIINVKTGLALDVDSKCDIKPGNTTDGAIECEVVLNPYSGGKRSQLWKIREDKGFLSLQNVSFERIISASEEKTIINRSFAVNTNYFKPVATKDSNYILLQGTFDDADRDEEGNAKLKFTFKCLQPDGNSVHIALFDEKQEARQSWKFVPVKEKATDHINSDILNQSNKLTKEFADEASKKVLTPGQAKSLIEQANTLKAKNDFDGAIRLLQQAVQLEPGNDLAFVEMAGAYFSKKDYANATAFAEKSRSLNAKNELAWNLLGLVAKDQNECEKAILDFSKVIEINPRANYTLTNRGYCYQALKKNDEAVTDFSKAIAIDGNNDAPYWGRAVSYGNLDRHEQSIADYTKYLSFKPNAAAYNNRGYQYFLLKRYDEAIADYRRSLEVDPNFSYAKGNLDWLLKNRPADAAATEIKNTAKQAASVPALILYPNIVKFSDINDYINKNLAPLQGSKTITQENLNKLKEISRYIDAYSEEPSHGPTYYGTVKRVQSNYYYVAGTIIAGANDFSRNPVLMSAACDYFNKSIEVEHSYNHLAFSPDLSLTRTTGVSIDPQTGDITSEISSETHQVTSGFKLAHRCLAYIQLHQNKADSALMNFITSYSGESDGRRLDSYTSKELLDFFIQVEDFANKAHSFDKDYINLCRWALGISAIKDYSNPKRDLENAAVAKQINRLVALAAQSPQKIQYILDFPFPDAIDRWDYELMTPSFYMLNKAGKLSYKGYEAKRFVTMCSYILKAKTPNDNTRLMLESLLRDNFQGYMQNTFQALYDKNNPTDSWGELLWYKSLSEKYPVEDEAARNLLDKQIERCNKKYRKTGPQPVHYNGVVLFQPVQ